MHSWQIALILIVWFFLGLAFWLALVFAGVGFLPAGARRAFVRAEHRIVRSATDRRKRRRPGSVDRRRTVVPAT